MPPILISSPASGCWPPRRSTACCRAAPLDAFVRAHAGPRAGMLTGRTADDHATPLPPARRRGGCRLRQRVRGRAALERVTRPGHVEATEVQVAAEVGGRIVELRVDEGDRVAAGDVIARSTRATSSCRLLRARAERRRADAQLRLLQAGSRAEDVRQAEAQVDAARAEIAAIDAEIRKPPSSTSTLRVAAQRQCRLAKATRRCPGEGRPGARTAARRRGARARGARGADGCGRRTARGDRRRPARVAAATRRSPRWTRARRCRGGVARRGRGDTETRRAGEMVAAAGADGRCHRPDHAWANLFVPEPLVPRLCSGRRPRSSPMPAAGLPGRSRSFRRTRSSRRATCRPPRSAPSWSIAIKVSVDNSAGIAQAGHAGRRRAGAP